MASLTIDIIAKYGCDIDFSRISTKYTNIGISIPKEHKIPRDSVILCAADCRSSSLALEYLLHNTLTARFQQKKSGGGGDDIIYE